MNILVCYASKHGATREIAEAIAQGVRHRIRESANLRDDDPPHVTVTGAEHAPNPVDFDAVIAGSAVYMGRWQRAAREWVDAHADRLANMPLWLFSSGPIGDTAYPVEEPGDIAQISALMDVRGTALFAGRLHRSSMHIAERAVVAALRVPDGDYRDWDRIRSWAGAIADELTPARAVPAEPSPIQMAQVHSHALQLKEPTE